jgi:hypothetical protein
MNLMQEKISELDFKINELQHIVQELIQQMNILTSFPDKNIQEKTESLSNLKDINPSSIIDDEYSDLNMEHKDILVGGNSWQYHSYRYKQMGMTAEVEIRRLTAQLTAAYNRIAALEEQLLSKKNAESKVTK